MSLKPPINPTSGAQSVLDTLLAGENTHNPGIENQTTPIETDWATSGDYADSTSGNIFHLASYVENTGSRATVAVFGGAKGNHVFGGNFVAYSNGASDAAIGVEIDGGNVSAAGGSSTLLVLKSAGGNIGGSGADTFIQMQAQTSSSADNGIIFHVSSGVAPVATTGTLIKHNGTATYDKGIDFSGATFTTAAIVLPSGADIALNATTGTKIGTSSTQKLGFWNATPVARPAAITDASTAHALNSTFSDVEVETALNALGTKINSVISALETIGLIATT